MSDKYKIESVNTFFRNTEYFREVKILTLVEWLGKEPFKVCTYQFKGATPYSGRTQEDERIAHCIPWWPHQNIYKQLKVLWIRIVTHMVGGGDSDFRRAKSKR